MTSAWHTPERESIQPMGVIRHEAALAEFDREMQVMTSLASLMFSYFEDWLTGDSQTASFWGLLIFHPSEFAPDHGTKLFL